MNPTPRLIAGLAEGLIIYGININFQNNSVEIPIKNSSVLFADRSNSSNVFAFSTN